MRSPLMALPIASLVAKSFVAMSFVAMSFVATSFVATSALALDLDVVNKSTTSLHHLYLSAPGADRWGDDQLGDGEDELDRAR